MKFVLALSVGPVGGFIGAGRRSRDLWYASSWLSETTRSVAKGLQAAAPEGVSVELLLPTKGRLDELDKAYRETKGVDGGRVSNKVLALVDCGGSADAQTTLRAIAEGGRARARAFLIEELERLARDPWLERIVDRQALALQIEAVRLGDFVEFSAGWAPLGDDDPFGRAVGRACALRDAVPKLFRHPEFSRPGVARSDLDEGRDSVLRADDAALRALRARAGLVESEELDAIGLVRRALPYLRRSAGDATLEPLPFQPVPNVAADPWLEGASKRATSALDDLRALLRSAQKGSGDDFFVWGSPVKSESLFGYEAGLLFEDGCDALIASVERFADPSGRAARGAGGPGAWPGAAKALETLREARRCVRRLHQEASLPIPYYALFELDGDKVGSLLAQQRRRADYERLVAALDAFAKQAGKAVEEARGAAFYVAGDELAAYVPLDRALGLVESIAGLYRDTLAKGLAENNLVGRTDRAANWGETSSSINQVVFCQALGDRPRTAAKAAGSLAPRSRVPRRAPTGSPRPAASPPLAPRARPRRR